MSDGDDDDHGLVESVEDAEREAVDEDAMVLLVDTRPPVWSGVDALEGLLDGEDEASAEAGPHLVVLVGRVLELGQGLAVEPEAAVSGIGHGARRCAS